MINKRKLLIVMLLLLFQNVSADVSAPFKINSIRAVSNGSFQITADATINTACSDGNFLHIWINQAGVNADGASAMLATALTALTTDKSVVVNYDPSSINCWVDAISISK